MKVIAIDRVVEASRRKTIEPPKLVSNQIMIDGVWIENTQEAITEFHENNRKIMEELRAEQEQKAQEIQTGTFCPLDRFASFMKECKKDCALYRDGGCTMKRKEASTDTEGKSCPFMRKCIKQCALYENGCTI